MGGASIDPRWPNFFIVGAARAGTTSLYFNLRKQPGIFIPALKELNFFASVDMDGLKQRHPWMRIPRTEAEYLRWFDGGTTANLRGDVSPSYLYDSEAPRRIKHSIPNAKIIAILRQPIERAFSHYLFLRSIGLETKPYYDAVLEDHYARNKLWLGSHLYVELGMYHQQVKRYLETFGAESIRIYLYDELAADSFAVYEDICGFLGADFRSGQFFEPSTRYNPSTPPNPALNMLRKIAKQTPVFRGLLSIAGPWITPILSARGVHTNEKSTIKPEMDARAVAMLKDIYRPDILELQQLIGRDLSGWL